MKKKMTLKTYGYDCGQFINFSRSEFYCFIVKGKLPTSIHFETQRTGTLANDHIDR